MCVIYQISLDKWFSPDQFRCFWYRIPGCSTKICHATHLSLVHDDYDDYFFTMRLRATVIPLALACSITYLLFTWGYDDMSII